MAKRVIDKFDLEAEREGNAIKGHTVLRTGQGKGIIKQRNMHRLGDSVSKNGINNLMGVME